MTTAGLQQVQCSCGCGVQLTRRVSNHNKDYFASRECHSRYVIQRYLADNCGAFKDLVQEYLEGEASIRYRIVATTRTKLVPFFGYLKAQGITSLESITPKTITGFITWSKKTRSRDVTDHICYISVFFKWAIATGYREAGNPVVPTMHGSRRKKRLPRPYSDAEMERTWNLLFARGNARLRFAAAIGEEAGLRISEVCHLRLSDIDVEGSRCLVRTPNKTSQERIAFFSEKTKLFYAEWINQRRSDVVHDYILHNTMGRPCIPPTLRDEFNSVLRKTGHGKEANDAGFDRWSFHRLRHTMATSLASVGADAATVMATGGWTTFKAMEGYTQISAETARNEYEEAMQRAEEEKLFVPANRTLTPAEFLARSAVIGRK